MEHPTAHTSARKLQTGARWAALGILVNFILAAVKIASGILGNSYALIADGVESSLDIFSSCMTWAGLKFAARPPDESHPYGHGKAEPVAAFVGALGLLAAAVLLAKQSVHAIMCPGDMPKAFTLLTLVLVILVKETLFRFVIKAGQTISSTAVQADAWHHRSDAITSAAAFLGISVALIGGPRFQSADAWAALVACGFIAFNGVRLLKPAIYEMLDTAPAPELERGVRDVAASVPGVREVEKCRVRKMGLQFYVDLHVHVDAEISVRAGHLIAHNVKDALRAANPMVADVLVHIEPDMTL